MTTTTNLIERLRLQASIQINQGKTEAQVIHGDLLFDAADTLEAQAKLDALEKQEPSHYMDATGLVYSSARAKFIGMDLPSMTALYAAAPVAPAQQETLTERYLKSELANAKAAQPLTKEQSKPKCSECAKWAKEQADNKDWIEGVAKGNEIIRRLAETEIKKGQQ